jgi:hypothetical protein
MNGSVLALTSDDIHAAKCRANAVILEDGSTPLDNFHKRKPVSEEERRRLSECYLEHREIGRRLFEFPSDKDITDKDKAQLDRWALTKALTKCGYLTFKRRWITPVIKGQKCANISG